MVRYEPCFWISRVCVRRSVSSEHSEQVGDFHAWSGAISCHDSLNLRKEVALPINYEGTLSSCSDKPGSIASASEALPPPLVDIDPGPRVEWDFNPHETCAARHTVRAAETEELKEVQKYL